MKTEVCIKIKVKREHILNGKAGETDECAIALAIKDACPNEDHIDVNNDSIVVGNALWETPKDADRFITLFDSAADLDKKPVRDVYVDGKDGTKEFKRDLKAWKKNFAKLKPFTLVLKKTIDDCSVLRGGAHE